MSAAMCTAALRGTTHVSVAYTLFGQVTGETRWELPNGQTTKESIIDMSAVDAIIAMQARISAACCCMQVCA